MDEMGTVSRKIQCFYQFMDGLSLYLGNAGSLWTGTSNIVYFPYTGTDLVLGEKKKDRELEDLFLNKCGIYG